jgi:hypothetical protein
MRLLACLLLLAACLCAPEAPSRARRSRTSASRSGATGATTGTSAAIGTTPPGGVDDKVWRGAVRFSLDTLPGGARVTSAGVELYFDGACVAPRRKVGPCAKVEYAVDAHAVLSPSLTKEREVDFDPVATASTTVSTTDARWSSLDLTGLVSDWATGVVPNRSVLLKLAEEEEDFSVSGPYFPSASFGTAALRPRLVASYIVPTTGVSP